jgi:hypothetical protein
MVFEIVGFEAEFDSLAALPADHMTDEHAIPVTFEGVFPASFMRCYTPAETFAAFMETSPWDVASLEEFGAIPDEDLDAYVDAQTEFPSWEEMVRSAGMEFFERVQYQ